MSASERASLRRARRHGRIPAPGTPDYAPYRRSLLPSPAPVKFLRIHDTTERNAMIADLWATGVLDTIDISERLGMRDSTVYRVLAEQREARR